MARQGGFFGRILSSISEGIENAIEKVFGRENEPPEEPPPRPPEDGEDDSLSEERAALRRIDSFHLERLPDRIDRNGVAHPAEYNRERVFEQLRDEPYGNLRAIQRMEEDEFRAWCRATGFFYH